MSLFPPASVMLWLLELLQSNNLGRILYAVYSIFCMTLAFVLAVMWVVPRWRDKLFTRAWIILFAFGAMGAFKIVFFALTEVYAWDSTAAFGIILIIGAAMAIGALIVIVRWVWKSLRGPQPFQHIARYASFWVAMLGGIFALDFVESRYQVPAFFIALGILLPALLFFQWRQDREWAAGTEQRNAEHRLKVIEELSRDPADAAALELYRKQPQRALPCPNTNRD